MALRSSWEGFLRLNLISVPVKAYSATQSGGGRISFHQIHAKCKSRIRYKKVCPIHGEVPNDEIVSGYEVAKGQYVLVKPEELKKLRSDADKSIEIGVFVSPDEIDPLYFTDRSYYITPSGRAGAKSVCACSSASWRMSIASPSARWSWPAAKTSSSSGPSAGYSPPRF